MLDECSSHGTGHKELDTALMYAGGKSETIIGKMEVLER